MNNNTSFLIPYNNNNNDNYDNMIIHISLKASQEPSLDKILNKDLYMMREIKIKHLKCVRITKR